ncbi:hypothetical protein KH5_04280 [Urechidicola sp. KH5]
MKKIISSALIIVAVSLTSCSKEKKEEHKHPHEHQTEEVAAAYYCPMECEGDKTYADKDAKCPVCKMDLVEKKSEEHDGYKKEGEGHDNEHKHS